MKKLIIISIIVIVLIVAAILVKRAVERKRLAAGLDPTAEDGTKAPVGMVGEDGKLTAAGTEILIATLQAANLSPTEIQEVILAANVGNEAEPEEEVVEEIITD